MTEYRLGTSIALLVPFRIKKQKQQKGIITNKLVITMVVTAVRILKKKNIHEKGMI